MKKIIASFFLMMILSFSLSLYLPWWSIAVACFLVSIAIPLHPGTAFMTGFFSLFLLWFFMSFLISYQNHDILAHRISPLFVKSDNPHLLMLVTALIGALVGGFASLSGSFVRKKKQVR